MITFQSYQDSSLNVSYIKKYKYISLFGFECMRICIISVTCLVAFDEKFDCFSPDELKSNSRSSRLMDAALTANSLVLDLDHSKNIKKSRSWKKFEKAMLFMEEYVLL